MMYLGRNAYLFQKDIGIKDANLAARLFNIKSERDGNAPLTSWQRISDITSFFAGKTDDVTYPEWQSFAGAVLGNTQPSAQDLAGDAAAGKLKANLDLLRKPKILSDVAVDPEIASKTKADLLNGSMGLRIFGQKFSLDAWILNDLTAGQESSPVRLPSTPSGLFVPVALGDRRARGYAGQFLANEKNSAHRKCPASCQGWIQKRKN
jgi:hypothetical protein